MQPTGIQEMENAKSVDQKNSTPTSQSVPTYLIRGYYRIDFATRKPHPTAPPPTKLENPHFVDQKESLTCRYRQNGTAVDQLLMSVDQ